VRIDIITIFPEYFGPLRVSLLGKAAERGIIQFAVHDLRTWAHDVHRTVDDAPFGGGPGMVMMPGPWGEALDAVASGGSPGTRLVVPTTAGTPFRQGMAAEYARHENMPLALLGWTSGCIVIWSSLFTVGNFLYGRYGYAALLLGVFVLSGIVLVGVIKRLWK